MWLRLYLFHLKCQALLVFILKLSFIEADIENGHKKLINWFSSFVYSIESWGFREGELIVCCCHSACKKQNVLKWTTPC